MLLFNNAVFVSSKTENLFSSLYTVNGCFKQSPPDGRWNIFKSEEKEVQLPLRGTSVTLSMGFLKVGLKALLCNPGSFKVGFEGSRAKGGSSRSGGHSSWSKATGQLVVGHHDQQRLSLPASSTAFASGTFEATQRWLQRFINSISTKKSMRVIRLS